MRLPLTSYRLSAYYYLLRKNGYVYLLSVISYLKVFPYWCCFAYWVECYYILRRGWEIGLFLGTSPTFAVPRPILALRFVYELSGGGVGLVYTFAVWSVSIGFI